jgi:alpha-aminoadipic semialdehyde synthase
MERQFDAASPSDHAVYAVMLDLDERYERIDGGPVTLPELSAHPERFRNGILKWLPRLTVLVNGMFWAPALPRLLSLEDMRTLWTTGVLARMRLIADISCDIDGAIEATVKATTPDNPVYVYDPRAGRAIDGFEGDGPVVLAVDNLPAELPRESSRDFGDSLVPFVPALSRCDWRRPVDELELPPELARAIIVHRGRLAPGFAHLQRFLDGEPSR